jgi:hypothetical protein
MIEVRETPTLLERRVAECRTPPARIPGWDGPVYRCQTTAGCACGAVTHIFVCGDRAERPHCDACSIDAHVGCATWRPLVDPSAALVREAAELTARFPSLAADLSPKLKAKIEAARIGAKDGLFSPGKSFFEPFEAVPSGIPFARDAVSPIRGGWLEALGRHLRGDFGEYGRGGEVDLAAVPSGFVELFPPAVRNMYAIHTTDGVVRSRYPIKTVAPEAEDMYFDAYMNHRAHHSADVKNQAVVDVCTVFDGARTKTCLRVGHSGQRCFGA